MSADTDPAAAPATVHRFRIGTTWRAGSDEPIRSIHPGDGSLVALVAQATLRDVDDCIAEAVRARDESGWRETPAPARGAILRRFGDRLLAEADGLARLLMRDGGTPLSQCRSRIDAAAGDFHHFAGVCETWQDDLSGHSASALAMRLADPIGVVVAIAPASSPLLATTGMIAPALAAGNVVVVKPSDQTPLLALELARIGVDVGLPAGVLSVLPGDGPEIGTALVKHPDVGLVSFCGSRQTGRAVATITGNRLIPVLLALRGNSPQIVFADAPFDAAVDAVVASMRDGIEGCAVGGTRVFIEKPLYSRFVDALVDRTRMLAVGLPADPRTDVGPLVSARAQARALRHLDWARADGARILVGGRPPDDPALAHGSFVLPTVLEGLGIGARLCREDVPGPIRACLPFRDAADVMTQANDPPPAAAAGIWTSDVEKGWRIGRQIDADAIAVNAPGSRRWATMADATRPGGGGGEPLLRGLQGYARLRRFQVGLLPEPARR